MEEKHDIEWRKSRIAARILLRKEAGPLSARDVRLARMLAEDTGVTNRLIDQAYWVLIGRRHQRRVSAQ